MMTDNNVKTLKTIVIAERCFSLKVDLNKQVVVRLGAPRFVDKEDWRCEFIIDGISEISGIRFAVGIDAFHSLIGALELIRQVLEPYRNDLVWEFGYEGDLGFYAIIPMLLGVEFYDRMKTLIDEEAHKIMK